VPLSVKIPMVLKNDRQALQACIKTCNRLDKENVTIVRMKNTNELEELEISQNLTDYATKHPFLEVISEPYEIPFNEKGDLF
jgi:hypothetical protein